MKDIGRGLGIDHNLINDMNKLIPMDGAETVPLDDAVEMVPRLKQFEEEYPRLFELVRKVENMPRSASIHPCGVLITPEPVHKSAPLMKGKHDERVAQYDGPTLEEIGLT